MGQRVPSGIVVSKSSETIMIKHKYARHEYQRELDIRLKEIQLVLHLQKLRFSEQQNERTKQEVRLKIYTFNMQIIALVIAASLALEKFGIFKIIGGYLP